MGLQLIATGLGDLFPASCVAVAVTGWCWARLGRLTAAVYATCFAGAVGAAFILKLVSNAIAPPESTAGLLTLSDGAPSGHAACAAVVETVVSRIANRVRESVMKRPSKKLDSALNIAASRISRLNNR